MRSTDCSGFHKGQLAVLLPETDGEGAWSFVDHVAARMDSAGVPVRCEVFRYPNLSSKTDGSDDDDTSAGSPLSGDPIARPNGHDRTNGNGNGHAHANGHVNGHGSNGHDRNGHGTTGADEDRRSDAPGKTDSGRSGARRPNRARRPVRDLAPLLIEPISPAKRALDIAVSGSLLLVLSPLLLIVAAIIKLTSPGPVIYRQQRVGTGGVPFTFFKFRSMYIDSDERREGLMEQNEADGPLFKMKNDPRMTPIGKIIRRTSIDELPQLWNVLRGNMTLVGPRPPILSEVENYLPWQRRRLSVRGGLTCIWQISGRSEVGFDEWMRMDARYIGSRSFVGDLGILCRTVGAVLSRRGAY